MLVGSTPNVNGSLTAGSLLILDANGHMVGQISNSRLLDGPWDLTINDHDDSAQVFVSNALSGTVTRIDLRVPDRSGQVPSVISMTQIASGYAHRPDPNALQVGPTGLAYDAKRNILYVASTGDNAIFAIRDASDTRRDEGMGRLVVTDDAHLHGPLGLVLPNGDLIAANGDAVNPDLNHPNEIVEYTPQGRFVGQFQLDSGAPGAAFGIALYTGPDGKLHFAAVDDNTSMLEVFTFGG